MLATRWDPFGDLDPIQNELNRLFGRTYGGGEESVGAGTWVPPLDVFENPDRFVVSIELPGIDPEAVEVSVEGSTLTVEGERGFSFENVSEDAFRRIERRYGAFTRSLSLPPTADADRIEASFEKGVLTIEVPKREEAKPKKITVKAAA